MSIRGICPTCGNKEQVLEVRTQRGAPRYHTEGWRLGQDQQTKPGELLLDILCSQGHVVTQVSGPADDLRREYPGGA